jgi:hypothetical protein
MPVSVLWLVGPSILLAIVAAGFARLAGLPPRVRIVIAPAAVLAGLIPLGPSSAAQWLLAVFGPTSAASLVLGVCVLSQLMGSGRWRFTPSNTLLASVLGLGLLLIPATAGLTAFDPFEFGYRGIALPVLMAALVAIGWFTRATDQCCWIALAACMHVTQAYGSLNLWTYLIDPIAMLAAAGWLAASCLTRNSARQGNQSKSV